MRLRPGDPRARVRTAARIAPAIAANGDPRARVRTRARIGGKKRKRFGQHMLQSNRLMEQRLGRRVPLPVSDLRLDLAKIMVYREADLRRTVDQAGGIHRLTYCLAGLPALPPGEGRDQLRLRLSAELPHPKPWT